MYELICGVSVNCFSAKEVPGGHEFFLAPNFEKNIKSVKAAGIHSIELCVSGLWKKEAIESTFHLVKDATAIVKDNGLTLNSVHLPFGFLAVDFTAPIERDRIAAVRFAADLCTYFKDDAPRYFVIHPGLRPTEEDRDIRIAQLIKSMNDFPKVTESKILVENMTNASLLNTSTEAKRVLDNSAAEMVIDLNHMLLETPQNYLKTVGKRVKGLHVSDRTAEKECHFLPGEGVLDYQDIIKTLEEIGYDGVFNYEVNYNYSPQQIKDNFDKLFAVYNA